MLDGDEILYYLTLLESREGRQISCFINLQYISLTQNESEAKLTATLPYSTSAISCLELLGYKSVYDFLCGCLELKIRF